MNQDEVRDRIRELETELRDLRWRNDNSDAVQVCVFGQAAKFGVWSPVPGTELEVTIRGEDRPGSFWLRRLRLPDWEADLLARQDGQRCACREGSA